jgi:hypothetical protein
MTQALHAQMNNKTIKQNKKKTGLEANRTCTGEQEVQREGLVRRLKKDWA